MDNKAQLKINLLKKKDHRSLDTFIRWAITGGRFLVILTETIALGAFLYRFNLDRQIVDFSDKIKAQSVIIESSKPDEDKYRLLLKKLKSASTIDQTSSIAPILFTKIAELTQSPIRFASIQMSEEKINITVSSPDVATLKIYVTSLQNLKELSNVSIDRIDNKTETADIDAAISAEVSIPNPGGAEGIPPDQKK